MFQGSVTGWCFMVNDYGVLGQTDLAGQTYSCPWTGTGARGIAWTLSAQALLKEKGFFHPVCLRIALECPESLEHNTVPIIVTLLLPSLTEPSQRGISSDGFTLTPFRTSELLGHTNIQLLFWKKSCRHICAWYSVTCSRPQQKDFLTI